MTTIPTKIERLSNGSGTEQRDTIIRLLMGARMKGLLQRLFENRPSSPKKKPQAQSKSWEIKHFNHGLVRIRALDFFGLHAESPSGQFHLIWSDKNPEGTRGGHRYEGHGSWIFLSQNQILAKGRLERPNDGQVADNGTFIFNDRMFGDGLNGRFHAFTTFGKLRLRLAGHVSVKLDRF